MFGSSYWGNSFFGPGFWGQEVSSPSTPSASGGYWGGAYFGASFFGPSYWGTDLGLVASDRVGSRRLYIGKERVRLMQGKPRKREKRG